MVNTNVYKHEYNLPQIAIARAFLSISFLFLLAFSIFAQANLSQPDENTLIVHDAPEMEVFAFGKTVIVKNRAKGVLSFGGDIIIEGEVTGDVATIGGSVIQKHDAFIGGDVIVFGGKYQHEDAQPRRNDGKQTVMYAGYEKELRGFMQNPASILSPDFSWGFIAGRVLAVLFWFIISLAVTTIAPGAVSRGVARFQLSTLRVIGIGALGFIVTTLVVILSLEFLPGFVSVIVGLMAFSLIMLAYVFGRVAMQVSLGKWIMKKFSKNGKKPPETIVLLIGTLLWTLFLSIPYLWTIGLFVLFTVSLGLILTARSQDNLQDA